MHEELKKQYEEDVNKYGKDAHKLWEYKSMVNGCWCGCYHNGPEWRIGVEYRRKKQPFEPEYFSGLNWRDALPLVEHVVEFSCDGEVWRGPYVLQDVIGTKHTSHRYRSALCNDYLYIRTTPETHAHPTVTYNVNGKEWVLPMPETEAPEKGMVYYTHTLTGHVLGEEWLGNSFENDLLRQNRVHLTEPRAQAWVDFWKNGIMAAVRGGDK